MKMYDTDRSVGACCAKLRELKSWCLARALVQLA